VKWRVRSAQQVLLDAVSEREDGKARRSWRRRQALTVRGLGQRPRAALAEERLLGALDVAVGEPAVLVHREERLHVAHDALEHGEDVRLQERGVEDRLQRLAGEPPRSCAGTAVRSKL